MVAFVVPDAIGKRMAGPAIRAIELARQVATVAEVRLVARHEPESVPSDLDVRVAGSDAAALRRAIDGVDVLVAFGGVLTEHPWLAQTDLHIVADAYDPAPLEALLQHGHEPMRMQWDKQVASQAVLSDQLRRADLVLCASTRQRQLLLGMLAALGRVNPLTFEGDPNLDRLVRILPFGTPMVDFDARRPGAVRGGPSAPIAEDAFVLCWGGGVYEWLDPLLLVEAVAACDDPSVVAYFMGVQHPSPDVPRMPVVTELTQRAAELGLLGSQVILGDGWVEYGQRAHHLVDADVGVSLHRAHIETTFAYRTRILDYLWAGLPVLASSGDALSETVVARGLGEVVEPGDLLGLVTAIQRLRDPGVRAAAGAQSLVVAREERWDSVARPLIDYCARPWRAPDLVTGWTSTAPSYRQRAAAAVRRAASTVRRPSPSKR